MASRIIDGGVKVLITADGVWRGNKLIHLLEVANQAMEITSKEGHVVDKNIAVCHLPRLHHMGTDEEKETYEKLVKSSWKSDRDSWWHEDMKDASTECVH